MLTIPLLATLASTTTAAIPYFHLSSFHASDIRIPSESHALSFTIANPGAVPEQGGSSPSNCNITWSSTPPTCWTPCTSSTTSSSYHTRICPDSYHGAHDFGVEIAKYFVYKNSALYNESVAVKEGKSDGYGCSRGGQSIQCEFRNGESGFDTDYEISYGPVAVSPSPVCGRE